MGIHNYCEFNCGGTDCSAPERHYTTMVVYLSKSGIEYKTIKDAAIDDIKNQPFFMGQ